jgi:NhaP-type Na+/H+ or K+/H+ antiporter
MTGHFTPHLAVQQFFIVSLGRSGLGPWWCHLPAPPHAAYHGEHRYLTLMTPYLMYIIAEEFHASGVLAVVPILYRHTPFWTIGPGYRHTMFGPH